MLGAREAERRLSGSAWVYRIGRYVAVKQGKQAAGRGDVLDANIFRYVWRYCRKWQVLLIAIALATQPLYLISLQLPKNVIDFITSVVMHKAVPGQYAELFPDLPAVVWLVLLCITMLGVSTMLGEAKRQTNVLVGRVGEEMLRRLRFQLLSRLQRFPALRLQRVGQGRIVGMVMQETEPLGGFIGEILVLPTLQGGLLVSALLFIILQDPLMGLAAIFLYPLQIYLIPRLQKKVNQLARRRVAVVREISERIGEIINSPGTAQAALARTRILSDFTEKMDRLYIIRLELFRRKFFIKFLNNFLALFTPFLFLLIGGWLVMEGKLTLGALTAAMFAYKDLAPPWKELLTWYQRKEDSQVKYEQLIEQFDLPDLIDVEPLAAEPSFPARFDGALVLRDVGVLGEGTIRLLDGISLTLQPGEIIAVTGSGSSGKDVLAQTIAGILRPDQGVMRAGEHELTALPRMVTGRRIGYVGADSGLLSGTVYENLILPIASQPAAIGEAGEDVTPEMRRYARLAIGSGNLPFNPNGNWLDPTLLGLAEDSDVHTRQQVLDERLFDVLGAVQLEPELLEFVLTRTIRPTDDPELAESLLQARSQLRQLFQEDAQLKGFVETFDPGLYNNNSAMAENILFGTPTDHRLAFDQLPAHPYIQHVLKQTDLLQRCEQAGLQAANTLIELFSDLPPGHRFFARYGFIHQDDLPELKSMVNRANREGIDSLERVQRQQLLGFAFRLTPGRHRLGIIDDSLRTELLRTRHFFAENIPGDLRDAIAFFDPNQYNGAMSIESNVLFGHIIYGQANAERKVRDKIFQLLDELNLRRKLIYLSLDFQVGINGARLSSFQHQKLVLARELMKQPEILVINEGLTALDGTTQIEFRNRLHDITPDMTQVWVTPDVSANDGYTRHIVLAEGRVTEDEPVVAKQADETESETETEKGPAEPQFGQLSMADIQALPESEQKGHLIARIPAFARLEAVQIQLLAQIATFFGLAEGETLFHAGANAEAAYIVIRGTLAVLAAPTQPGGKEREIRQTMPGDVIGEASIVTGDVRSATIRAVTECQLLSLPRELFSALLQENGSLSYALLADATRRLSLTTQLLNTAT